MTMAGARKGRRNGRRGRNGAQNSPRAHEAAGEAPRMMREQGQLGADSTGAWADLNQRVMRDFADLWLRGARESTRALTQIQEANLEAWREAQGAAFRWLRRGVAGVDTRGTGTSRAA
jgi:hypothetical protein